MAFSSKLKAIPWSSIKAAILVELTLFLSKYVICETDSGSDFCPHATAVQRARSSSEYGRIRIIRKLIFLESAIHGQSCQHFGNMIEIPFEPLKTGYPAG